MLQENEGPKPAEDIAVDAVNKTPAERQGRRNDDVGQPSTEGAIDHFAQNRFAKYDAPGGVDTGDDPSVGLGKELHERRDEAEEDRKKNARKNKVVGVVSGTLAVGAAIVAGALPNSSAPSLHNGDKPALTVPNDASLAPTQPEQVQYNGVHTADAPIQSDLPTAPADPAFAEQVAETEQRQEQQAQELAEKIEQDTGGASADTQVETGGAAPRTQ